MATVTWEVVETWECERAQKLATLVERRVYPSEVLPDTLENRYKVLARQCTLATDCNVFGVGCKYSGLNPDIDPLYDSFDIAHRS